MKNAYYESLLKLIERKGARQEIFTFAELRDDLGVDSSDRTASGRVWNAWNTAKRKEIIKYSDPYEKRTRNRRYAMGDIGALSQELASTSGSSRRGKRPDSKSSGSEQSMGKGMLDRLSRIEERLNEVLAESRGENGADEMTSVLNKLEILDAKVNRLLAVWA